MAVRAFTSVCANVVLCPEIHISDRDVGAGCRIRAEDAVRGATLAVGNIAVPVLDRRKNEDETVQRWCVLTENVMLDSWTPLPGAVAASDQNSSMSTTRQRVSLNVSV